MPTPPYAKLLARLNGGSPQSGGILAAFGDSVVLSSEDTAHPYAFRFEIYEYPDGFALPAGWSLAGDGFTYYYSGSSSAPAFTLPADTSLWGDFLLRLTINNGDPGVSGLPASQFVDEATALRILSASGVQDTGFSEGNQFDTQRGAVGSLKADLRLLDQGLGGGFGSTSIADHSVTYVKLQQLASHTLIGNPTGSTANAQAVGVTNGIEFTGTSIGLADGGVTYARMQDVSAQARLLGRGGASGVGPPEELTAGGGIEFSGTALQRSALTGDVTAAAGSGVTAIGANKVTLGMMAAVAGAALLGALGAGNVAALTGTQATTLLDVATVTDKGLVPAPTASSGRYFRDDLTWASVSGAFTGPADPGDDAKLAYASGGDLAYASAIKTDGTYLAFGTASASGLLRSAHGVIFWTGLTTAPADAALLSWGVGTDNRLTIGSTGVGSEAHNVATGGSYLWQINSSTAMTATAFGLALSPAATTGTVSPALSVTDAAHTSLTASTERHSVLLDLSSTKTWATGAISDQRSLLVVAPTLAFAAASTVGRAATVSISGAPIAGANATLTQSVALLLESGGIAYGSGAALSGLNRVAQPAVFLAGRSSTATDVNLVSWGTFATDQLVLGADGAASVYAHAATSFGLRLGGGTAWTFSATELDANSHGIVNLLSVNGTRVALGVLGSELSDANATLSVAGGSVYEQLTAFTANRSIALDPTGATANEAIEIRRHVTDGFTLTVTNGVGTPLYTFPAGQKRSCLFVYDSTAGQFREAPHLRIA